MMLFYRISLQHSVVDHEDRRRIVVCPRCHDTVGAVAVDSCGNVACATSTGGIRNKMVGRVGDSPVIGRMTHFLPSCQMSFYL